MAAASEPALDDATIRAVAHQVAVLLRRDGDGTMLMAAQVAARFNVERSWVYAHADELGVVRLGDGPRPRLRFDAAVVAQRLATAPGRIPAGRTSISAEAHVPLLPIRRSRRRRLAQG